MRLKRSQLALMLGMLSSAMGASPQGVTAVSLPKTPPLQIHNSDANNKSNNTLQFAPGPPPGFSAAVLDQEQTTLVSVYYGGEFVGNFMASFTQNWLQFANPSQVQASIPGWIHPKAMAPEFAAKLPVHTDHVCRFDQPHPDPRSSLCTGLTPQTMGLVFDANNYKAYLFVNPDLLKPESLTQKPLAPSSSGFSVFNQMGFAVQTSGSSKNLSEANNLMLANHENRLFLLSNFNYTHSQYSNTSFSPAGSSNTSVLNISQFGYGRVIDQKDLFQAGILSTIGDDFISGMPLLGASWQNSYWGVGNDTTQLVSQMGTPVYVDLTLPSQVSLYRGGELLYSTHLDVGRQQVNTSTLPEGAYMLTIRTTNSLGQESTQQLYFVKQQNFSDQSYHYTAMLGAQSKTAGYGTFSNATKSFTVSAPQFTDAPLFNYNGTVQLSSALGVTETFLSNFEGVFSSTGLNWYLPYQFNFQLGGMVSNQETTGGMTGLSWNDNSWSASVNALKTFTSLSQDQLEARYNNPSQYFYPMSGQDYTVNSNLQYRNLGFGYTLSQSVLGGLNRSGSINYTQTLYQGSMSNVFMMLNLTKSNDDTSINLSLNYNMFTDNNLDAMLSYGYQQTRIPAGSGSTGSSTSTSQSFSGNVTKTVQFDSYHSLQMGISGNQQGETRSVNLQSSYLSPWLNTAASYARAYDSEGVTGTQIQSTFSGTLNTSFLYADHHLGMGYSGSQWFTGIIINIKAPVSAKVAVYVDGTQVAVVNTNMPQPIFLTPYKTYHITVVPLGSTLLSYNAMPKSATLYQGNVETMTWSMGQQYLLFAQVYNAQKQPLANWLLENKNEFDTTDNTGFLQASVTTNEHVLTFRSIDGQTCVATLPVGMKIAEQVSVLKTPLMCEPVVTSRAAKPAS